MIVFHMLVVVLLALSSASSEQVLLTQKTRLPVTLRQNYVDVSSKVLRENPQISKETIRILGSIGATKFELTLDADDRKAVSKLIYVEEASVIEISCNAQEKSDGRWKNVPVINSNPDSYEQERKLNCGFVQMTLRWNQPISELGVKIKTRDRFGAGTDNQVWFDAGFKAWSLNKRLYNDFERGDEDSYELPLPDVPLHWDDLFEVRLEKKGLFGFTGLWGGLGGGWEPESVTLYVNGKAFGETILVPEGTQLSARNPAWRHLLKPLGPQERLGHGLRAEINPEGTFLDEVLAALTTPLGKKNGISGWQTGPIPDDPELEATVIGTIKHRPSPGWDGFVSLDLDVETLKSGMNEFHFNTENGILQKRYIRVEYLHGGNPWPERGARVRISGIVRWDTDRGGFYEIHPRGPWEVEVLNPTD